MKALFSKFRTAFSIQVISLSLILVSIDSNSRNSYKYTVDDIKAALIYKISDHVYWPDEVYKGDFKIVYLGEADKLFHALKNKLPQARIRDKGFSLRRATIENIDFSQTDILVIPQSKTHQLSSISEASRRTDTLIISDSSSDKRDFMVNLYQAQDGSVKFEVNRNNIIFEYLKLSRDVLLLGGTELDIAELFRETELELEAIRSELSEKKSDLTNLSNKLAYDRDVLNQQKKVLLEKNRDIQNKEAKIKEANEQLRSITQELKNEQQSLEKNEVALKSREQKLIQLESELLRQREQIASNSETLKQQEEIIDQNKTTLIEKEGVISQQRNLLILLSLAILMLVVLFIYILKINNERRKTNSELLKVQKELEKSKTKAETANKAKSVFLANMSHELRTPLNAILGFSQIMLNEIKHNKSLTEYVSIIHNSGSNLLTLINDILEISKIEAGKTELNTEAVYLENLLKNITSMLTPKASDNDSLIRFETHNIKHPVFVDAQKLHQIILNLANNATKFTVGGEILIEAEEDQQHPGDFLFSVSDTGIGISEEDQKTIFKPFTQVDTQFKSAGTGLGLSISKQFLHLMGSELKVESEPGKGSRFYFRVSLKYAQKEDVKQAPEASKLIGAISGWVKLSIIIADDDGVSRLLCRKMLEPLDADIYEAKDGVESLTLLKNIKADLLITDWNMPKMAGIELAKEVKKLPIDIQPKIIMLSAHVFKSDIDQAMSAGVDKFIQKPVNADRLYSTIESLTKLSFEREQPEPDEMLSTDISQMEIQSLSAETTENFTLALKELNPRKLNRSIETIAGESPELAKKIQHRVTNKQYRTLLEAFNLAPKKASMHD